MSKSNLVEAVKEFAIRHYSEDGWDIIVECYSDNEIKNIIGKARTEQGAIKKVREANSAYSAYRDEIRSTAF